MAIEVGNANNGIPMGSYIPSSGGTTDYEDLTNKPTINSISLEGNKTSTDLSLASSEDVTNLEAQLNNKQEKFTTNNPLSLTQQIIQNAVGGNYTNGTFTATGSANTPYLYKYVRFDAYGKIEFYSQRGRNTTTSGRYISFPWSVPVTSDVSVRPSTSYYFNGNYTYGYFNNDGVFVPILALTGISSSNYGSGTVAMFNIEEKPMTSSSTSTCYYVKEDYKGSSDTYYVGRYVSVPKGYYCYTTGFNVGDTFVVSGVQFTLDAKRAELLSKITVAMYASQEMSMLNDSGQIEIKPILAIDGETIIFNGGSGSATQNSLELKISSEENNALELKDDGLYSSKGATDYTALTGKPKINGIEVTSTKTAGDLNLSYPITFNNPLSSNVYVEKNGNNARITEGSFVVTPPEDSRVGFGFSTNTDAGALSVTQPLAFSTLSGSDFWNACYVDYPYSIPVADIQDNSFVSPITAFDLGSTGTYGVGSIPVMFGYKNGNEFVPVLIPSLYINVSGGYQSNFCYLLLVPEGTTWTETEVESTSGNYYIRIPSTSMTAVLSLQTRYGGTSNNSNRNLAMALLNDSETGPLWKWYSSYSQDSDEDIVSNSSTTLNLSMYNQLKKITTARFIPARDITLAPSFYRSQSTNTKISIREYNYTGSATSLSTTPKTFGDTIWSGGEFQIGTASAQLKISSVEGNTLEIKDDGLYAAPGLPETIDGGNASSYNAVTLYGVNQQASFGVSGLSDSLNNIQDSWEEITE